jgi:hypothetical protein
MNQFLAELPPFALGLLAAFFYMGSAMLLAWIAGNLLDI